jgi:hypothetical protein
MNATPGAEPGRHRKLVLGTRVAPTSSNKLATEAEIDAVLKEAEANAQAIPSLDAGPTVPVVPVPVEPPPRPHTANVEQSSPRPDVGPPPSATAPSAAAVVDYGEHGFLYRSIDLVLWLVNRPFQFATPTVRRLVGFAALVTLGTSALALYLLPKLLPPRDTISVFKRQIAEVRAAAAATTATPREPQTPPAPARPGSPESATR